MSGDTQPVHKLLEDSADARAEAVAIVHGEQSWSYAQVEAEANRTAALLIEQGVVRGDRVALLAENGIEYVTGLFGILKAGGCTVALSGANHARTNRDLLRDCGAVGLVTRAVAVRKDLPDGIANACQAGHIHNDDVRWLTTGGHDVLLQCSGLLWIPTQQGE